MRESEVIIAPARLGFAVIVIVGNVAQVFSEFGVRDCRRSVAVEQRPSPARVTRSTCSRVRGSAAIL
jgi:hypothetical protein